MIPSKIKYHDKYIPVHQIYNENYFLTPIQFRSESVLVLLVEYVPAEGPRMDALVAPIICPTVRLVLHPPSSIQGMGGRVTKASDLSGLHRHQRIPNVYLPSLQKASTKLTRLNAVAALHMTEMKILKS